MATLEKIRNKAGLLVTVIAVALFAFIIGDGLRSGSTWFQQDQQVALDIDGKDISIQDFQARLTAAQEQYERSGQRLTDEQRVMLSNQLAQEYISQYALEKVAQQVGLQVTGDEFYALLSGQGVTPSPVAQQFLQQFGIDGRNQEAVNQFLNQISEKQIKSLPAEQQGQLRAIQTQWQGVQRTIINSRLQEKLSALLSRSYKLTKVDQELTLGKETRQVALVRTSAAQIADSTKVSDDEVKKYYESHKDFFRMQYPAVEVNYIALQVIPSSEDFAAAEKEKVEAQQILADAQGAKATEEAIRAFSNKFFSKVYLTGAELEKLGLGASDVEFLKSASVGQVHDGGLVDNRYNLVKLVDKKQGTEALGIRMIALDSVGSLKSDSLVRALAGGADFATMAKEISIDPQTKENGGLLSMPGQYGMTQDSFTEAETAQMGLDTLYKVPVGQVVVLERGSVKFLLKAVDPKALVEKYQVASVSIDANFSDKTYNDRYATLNKVLAGGGSFDELAKRAEKEGLSPVRNLPVVSQMAQLAQIPSSRSIITWAVQAKDNQLNDKIFRCGTDYLVIAATGKHTPAGFSPLAMVKDQIEARLTAEKRADNLVKKLEGQKLASLDAYAQNLDVRVDTLVGVSYLVRGSEAATFNGRAMTTKLGTLSQPFRAGNEVMVVSPLSTEAVVPAQAKAQINQQATELGRQLSFRAFSDLIQALKVQDNRYRFF